MTRPKVSEELMPPQGKANGGRQSKHMRSKKVKNEEMCCKK